jgi:hypothetical protein
MLDATVPHLAADESLSYFAVFFGIWLIFKISTNFPWDVIVDKYEDWAAWSATMAQWVQDPR